MTLIDVDQGDVTTSDPGAAAEAVFGAQVGDVVGQPYNIPPAKQHVTWHVPASTHSASLPGAVPLSTASVSGTHAILDLP